MLPPRETRDELPLPNDFINRVRQRVTIWRKADYPGVTPTTRMLLEHWRNPDREPSSQSYVFHVLRLALRTVKCQLAERDLCS